MGGLSVCLTKSLGPPRPQTLRVITKRLPAPCGSPDIWCLDRCGPLSVCLSVCLLLVFSSAPRSPGVVSAFRAPSPAPQSPPEVSNILLFFLLALPAQTLVGWQRTPSFSSFLVGCDALGWSCCSSGQTADSPLASGLAFPCSLKANGPSPFGVLIQDVLGSQPCVWTWEILECKHLLTVSQSD